jgi:predicted nucleic acid-binding protein
LAQANKEAKEMIEGILELSIITIVSPRMEIFMNSMKLSHEIPLLSSDSIILANALFAKVKGLISLDSDMKTAPIDIYTTQIKNHEFEDNIYD